MAYLVLQLTDEQCQAIQLLAQRRGYEMAESYILSLVAADARSKPPSSETKSEATPDSFEANFQEALHEILQYKRRTDQ
jgi:hypothetical protein